MGCDFSGLRNRFAKAYKQRAIDIQTKMLLSYAPQELQRAYENRSFKNRTYNLADSYVWVVYYCGEVQGSGFMWAGSKAQSNSIYEGKSIDGRQLADDFINSYQSNISSGWELVLAAAAPYAYNLESGEGRSRRFYVISSVFDEITSDFRGKATVIFTIDKS